MLLKPAAAQAVSEVSKKSHPAHPTFLFFWISFFLDDVFDSDYAITRGVVLGQLSKVSLRPAVA